MILPLFIASLTSSQMTKVYRGINKEKGTNFLNSGVNIPIIWMFSKKIEDTENDFQYQCQYISKLLSKEACI